MLHYNHKRGERKEGKKMENVKVGDVFVATWGYEQTNNDFFQVIALAGKTSVRVRQVKPVVVSEEYHTSMSADFTVDLTGELEPVERSFFIKDQEKGDLKRITTYGGVPEFKISSYARAHKVSSDKAVIYESWYY